MHGLAQTYALDITHEPPGAPPRAMDRLWPPMRRPQEFPSFGWPVRAPFDGVVVAARGTSRGHLTRLSPLGLIVMLFEGFVRSLGAPRHLLGNHVLLRAEGTGIAARADAPTDGAASGSAGGLPDGPAPDVPPDGTVVALLAHLRRGSLQVAQGERVTAGQQLAECGNSGNSSDPHVHFQLMDGPDLITAHGLPFEWEYFSEDSAPRRGGPACEELFVVEGPE